MIILAKLMRESWSPAPAARLTALRVKKTLGRLLDQLEEDNKHNITNNESFGVVMSSEKDSLFSSTSFCSSNSGPSKFL